MRRLQEWLELISFSGIFCKYVNWEQTTRLPTCSLINFLLFNLGRNFRGSLGQEPFFFVFESGLRIVTWISILNYVKGFWKLG